MQCPYWFFVKDILCLDDADNGTEASPLLLGILLHTVLEDFTHRAKDEKKRRYIVHSLASGLE